MRSCMIMLFRKSCFLKPLKRFNVSLPVQHLSFVLVLCPLPFVKHPCATGCAPHLGWCECRGPTAWWLDEDEAWGSHRVVQLSYQGAEAPPQSPWLPVPRYLRFSPGWVPRVVRTRSDGQVFWPQKQPSSCSFLLGLQRQQYIKWLNFQPDRRALTFFLGERV